MARKDNTTQVLMEFAGNFATACEKIKQGADKEGTQIHLTQGECVAIIDALRIGFKKGDK